MTDQPEVSGPASDSSLGINTSDPLKPKRGRKAKAVPSECVSQMLYDRVADRESMILLDSRTNVTPDLPNLLRDLRETHMLREDLIRARNRLGNQLKAVARRLRSQTTGIKPNKKRAEGEHRKPESIEPQFLVLATIARPQLQEAFDGLDKAIKVPTKKLEKLAEHLPAWAWVKNTRGVGALIFAEIVAECGDLRNYATKERVWKRMGVGCTDGQRDRKIKGIENGYSPRRHAIVYNLGASMLRTKGAYYQRYLDRKTYEEQKSPDLTPAHRHRRASRYMEKGILWDLWQEWKRVFREQN